MENVSNALKEYQENHNEQTLEKLCFEVSEFCKAIYASTHTEQERKIFKKRLTSIAECDII